jgi:hypothetical protein
MRHGLELVVDEQLCRRAREQQPGGPVSELQASGDHERPRGPTGVAAVGIAEGCLLRGVIMTKPKEYTPLASVLMSHDHHDFWG